MLEGCEGRKVGKDFQDHVSSSQIWYRHLLEAGFADVQVLFLRIGEAPVNSKEIRDPKIQFCGVDVALIIRSRKSGQYFTYNSLDLGSWPPSKAQMVSPWFGVWRGPLLTAIIPATSNLAPT